MCYLKVTYFCQYTFITIVQDKVTNCTVKLSKYLKIVEIVFKFKLIQPYKKWDNASKTTEVY